MNNPRRWAYCGDLPAILLVLALFGLAEGCGKPQGPEKPKLTPAELVDEIEGWYNMHSGSGPNGTLRVWTSASVYGPSQPIDLRLRLFADKVADESSLRANVEVRLRPVATENLLRKATFNNVVWRWKKDFMAWEAVIKDVFTPAELPGRREALAEGQYVLDVVTTPVGESPIEVRNTPIEVLFTYP